MCGITGTLHVDPARRAEREVLVGMNAVQRVVAVSLFLYEACRG